MSVPIGITFSHPHIEWLGLSVPDALSQACEFGFSHIRLGAYWDRIESSSGKFSFSELNFLLKACERAEQPVVLTVGVKAPRWPEYYWPGFVEEKVTKNPETCKFILRFIDHTVKACRRFNCITHWQVENEPLNLSGPENRSIPEDLLRRETELVRSIDSRPLMINLWGNDLLARRVFSKAEALADVVGVDLYFRQYIGRAFGRSVYSGPRQSARAITRLLQASTKSVWISELQAEPWEADEEAYRSEHPQSISPEKLAENVNKAEMLPVKEILLWGFEYWLWRAKQGDDRYMETVRRLVGAK